MIRERARSLAKRTKIIAKRTEVFANKTKILAKEKTEVFANKTKMLARKNVAKAKNLVGAAERSKKKNYTNVDKFFGYVELMRPLEWSKTLFTMVIGLLIAFYVFGVHPSLYHFAAGLGTIFILWSGLYTLNDWMDWKNDLLHKSKHIRPIPSGKILPKNALIFSLILVAASFVCGLVLANKLFLLCMGIMLLNQLAYTLPPLRLKDRKFFDIISGAFVNPIVRYLCGLFLFISLSDLLNVGFPILPVLFVTGIQVGSYVMYRFSSKEHDTKLNVASTAARLTEKRAKIASRFLILVGVFSLLAIIGNYYLLKNSWLGYVPIHYLLAIIPGLFIAPLVRQIVKSPTKATDPKSYKLVYASFHIASVLSLIFVLGIFVYFP